MTNTKQNSSPTVAGIWRGYRFKISGTLSLLTAERLLGVAVPSRWRIHLSDLEARNYAFTDVLLSALIVSAVVITVRTGSALARSLRF